MTVLVFLSSIDFTTQWMMRGIQRRAADFGWDLQTIEYSQNADGRYRLVRAPGGPDLGGVLDFWKPDGCLVDCGGAPKLLGPADFPGIPTVFVDRHPSTIAEGASCVFSDPIPIARAAARELLLCGFDDYAFVPCPGHDVWSRERGEAFLRLVREAGKGAHAMPDRRAGADARHVVEFLSKWLPTLPRPCGVFVANDLAAESVLVACAGLGLAVPEDIAVVGVDNSEHLCENTHPTLTSIEKDLFGAGQTSVEMLAESIRRGVPVPSRPFGIVGLVRRASSRRVRSGDRRVRRALDYIRRHACEGAEPPDVVREMGVCRTLADRVFRKAVGHTILDEIHAVRLERVKALLLRHVATVAIPGQCGYHSVPDLRRVFRQRVGCTLREWERAQRVK
jgi:LacI family transcriptional regulator